MTDAQRRLAITKLIAEHTRKSTVSKKVARETLIGEGIYTAQGELRAEYGGVPKKRKAAT